MKAYVIIAGKGEYSDRHTWPVRVYTKLEMAQAYMKMLEAVSSNYRRLFGEINRWNWDELREAIRVMNDKAKKDYASLGINVDTEEWDHDFGWETDWELAEADFVNE